MFKDNRWLEPLQPEDGAPDQFDWPHPQPFLRALTVTDEHIDEIGHTNNVIYLHWLQQLGWAHSASLGLDWNAYAKLGYAMVAAHHSLNYHADTRPGDRLLLATWHASGDGRLRMRRGYQIVRLRDRKTVLTGYTDWISVRLASGKPARMPAEFATAYKV